MRSAEVVFPASDKICPLPNLPSTYKEHTQDGVVLCGGKEGKSSCYTLKEDGWTKSHDLIKEFVGHNSWETVEGILLMGGNKNPTNTELGEDIFKIFPPITRTQLSPTVARRNPSV